MLERADHNQSPPHTALGGLPPAQVRLFKDDAADARSHAMTAAPEVVARLEALALAHPAYDCNWLEGLLALTGRRVLAISIQKILNDKGLLGRRQGRWLALERQNAEEAIELTPISGFPGEAQPLLPRAARRERAAGSPAVGGPLHGGHAKGESAESTCTWTPRK